MRISSRVLATVSLTLMMLPAMVGFAMACGSLVAPNGTVRLVRTATLAAYHEGVEHYVTSFEFAGATGEFGSIIPLPDVPTKVERAGDWTLQRLVREVRPPVFALALQAARDTSREAKVLYETKIDALDITVLEGGADEVVAWAESNDFDLTSDTPEALAFYADRSPIFMAAKFDAAEASRLGQAAGDGTPIHLTIPTDDPWVPLHILSVGKPGDEIVEADVFLLTDSRPELLPLGRSGISLERSEPASEQLMSDLSSDEGMGWMPDEMWLSYVKVDAPAEVLTFDLAVGIDGPPSRSDAFGLPIDVPAPAQPASFGMLVGIVAVVAVFGFGLRKLEAEPDLP